MMSMELQDLEGQGSWAVVFRAQ